MRKSIELYAATLTAQTLMPRRDAIIDAADMSTTAIFSSLRVMNGFYQIMMRDQYIPYTAVGTPSGMLW